MKDLLRRIRWLASGAEEDPGSAFDWVSGRPGARANPEGLRSVVGTAAVFAVGCLLADMAILARHEWRFAALLAGLHVVWAGGFVAAAMASVGYLETVDGRRMRGLGGPNTITLARAVFVPSLIYLLAVRDFGLGLIAYAALVLSDIADGWWARHGKLRSKFGIVLDPVADLFLHGAVFSTLGLVGLLPRIAILLILLRSGLLIVGSGLLHFHKGSVRIQPTPFGKGSGVLLGLATSWLLALEGFAPGREPELTAILRGVLTSLLALLVLHALAIGIINLGWRKPWLDQRRRGLNEENGDDRRGRREP